MAMKDLTGMRFGAITVLRFERRELISKSEGYKLYWRCQCDCGKETVVVGQNLKRGNTSSCGCKSSRAMLGGRMKRHGLTDSPTYITWRSMKERCLNKEHADWETYGGRGISLCDRWQCFEHFLADMGVRPVGKTLDRIDVDGNYEPGNCRWATPTEQARNKRTNWLIEFGGETLTLQEWAERFSLKVTTLRHRLKKGWSAERALTQPLGKPWSKSRGGSTGEWL